MKKNALTGFTNANTRVRHSCRGPQADAMRRPDESARILCLNRNVNYLIGVPCLLI